MNTAIRIKDNNLVDLITSCTPRKGARDLLERNPEDIDLLDIGRAIEQCISNVSGIPMCENRRQKGMDLVDGTEVKFGTVGKYVDKKGFASYSVTIGNIAKKLGDVRVVMFNQHDTSDRKMLFLYIPNELIRPYKDGTISITLQYDKDTNEFNIIEKYKVFQVQTFEGVCLSVDVSRKNFESNKLSIERSIKNLEMELLEAEKEALDLYEKSKKSITDAMDIRIKTAVKNGDLGVLDGFSPKEHLIQYYRSRCGVKGTEQFITKISKIRSTSTVSTRLSHVWSYRKKRALSA